MIPLTLVYFTTSLGNTFPEARTQFSFLLLLGSDPRHIYVLVVANQGQGLWLKQLFSLGWIQSCLLEAECLFASCIPETEQESHCQLLHDQDTSSITCKCQNSQKYLLTFHYSYSLKYQAAASLWNFCDVWNRGFVTGIYIHIWVWMRNPKASWYHLQVKSLSMWQKPSLLVALNSPGTCSKRAHILWSSTLTRFGFSLTSELQDPILDSSDILWGTKRL